MLNIIKTTFTTQGGGLNTSFLSERLWRAFVAASGGKGRSALLEYAGHAILVSIILLWVTGLWLGLFLMLLSEDGSILRSSTRTSTDALEKLYYAGFTLSTLGVGDYIASNNTWRIVTSCAAFSGLAFITASITYFVPVLSAVSLQSKIGLYVSSMGGTPQEILLRSWNGRDFSSFSDSMPGIAEMVMQHTLNHRSHPVIHYYHNSNQRAPVKWAIVVLDEALQILQHAVTRDAGADVLKLSMLKAAVDAYLSLVEEFSSKSSPGKGKPPVPSLDELRSKGIPLAKEGADYVCREDTARHWEALTALRESGGWSWQDVY